MKNIQDHNKYIEVIKSGGRQDTIEKKLEAFEYFSVHGSPSDLWLLSEFLFLGDPVLRKKAADIVIQLFKLAKSREELHTVAKHVRLYQDSLDVFRKFPPAVYFELVVIASFNGDGYIRQKAVWQLRESRRPEAIRYILYRAGDWVMQVRDAASAAIRAFFLPGYRDAFIRLLPEVEWLLEVKRADLSGLYAEITNFITREELAGESVRKAAISEKPRLLLFRLYLKKDGSTRALLQMLSTDTSFLIRVELLKYYYTLPTEDQRELLLTLLQDRSAKVRLHALYAIKPFRETCKEEIISLLSDPSASIREWARLFLRSDNIDLPVFYRNKIKAGDLSSGNIMGLSETGSAEDMPIFEKYFQDSSSRLQLTSLSAMARLDSDLAIKYALTGLASSFNRLRAKSVEILAKSIDPGTLERIREVYRSGDLRQKRSILIIYNRMGGWKVVADIMLALTEPSEEIAGIAWGYLQKWREKAAHLFTSPSLSEHARAHEAYDSVEKAHLVMSYWREKLWKELPFFLRN